MKGSDGEELISLLADEGAICQITYVSDAQVSLPGIRGDHRAAIAQAAQEFVHRSGGDVVVLVSGRLQSGFGNGEYNTETAVANCCRPLLGDPGEKRYDRGRTVDLVLDTLGGSLDSAFKIVLYLSHFTSKLRVFVPRRAKSAGTLIAVGTQSLYLTPFAELGPLDTQIRDPRNPTATVSALDCYQSVDYVRAFGLSTLKRALLALGGEIKTGIPLSELLATAAGFAHSSTEPMLANVKPLDFGGWGRTLRIGEMYTQILLGRAGYDGETAASIATKLVYGYTHHPFPIDKQEAESIGLSVKHMGPALAAPALQMITECADLGLEVAVGAWRAERGRPFLRLARRPAQTRESPGPGALLPRRNGQLTGEQEQATAVIDPLYFTPPGRKTSRTRRWRFWPR